MRTSVKADRKMEGVWVPMKGIKENYLGLEREKERTYGAREASVCGVGEGHSLQEKHQWLYLHESQTAPYPNNTVH